MRYIQILIVTCLILLLAGPGALAAMDWKTYKTEHFTVFYQPGFEQPAKQVLHILEFYRPQLEQLTGNEVKGLPVVIEDTGYTNGFANPSYQNIHLFITPPTTGTELGSTENWWSLVGPHEYIHLLSLQKTAGVIGFFKAIFGNVFLPNADAPGWVVEGISVYGESTLSPYQGRLNDGYYDAYLGACVRDNYFPTLAQATFSPFRYPFSGRYLFGGEFLNFLARTYGAEKFALFFKANGASALNLLGIDQVLPLSGIDLAARNAFGKTFPALWREWQDYERERFKDFAMEGEQLTKDGWYIYDCQYDNYSLYYQRRRAVEIDSVSHYSTEVIRYDTQSRTQQRILATTSSFKLPLRIHQNKLYYAVTEIKPGYANVSDSTYGEYAVLHEKNLATSADRVILADEIRAYDISEDGTLLFAKDRKGASGSELYSLAPGARKVKYLFKTDLLIQEITAESGRIVAAAQPEWHNANVYLVDLEKQTLNLVLDSPYQKMDLLLQGDKLFYVSNVQNQYRTYCYDFSNNKTYRLTANGYSLSPAYDKENNQLYYIGLTSKGNELYREKADFKEYQVTGNLTPPRDSALPVTLLAADTSVTSNTLGTPEASAIPGEPLESTALNIPIEEGNYGDNFKTLLPVYRKLELTLNDQGAVDECQLDLYGSSAVGDLSYDNKFSYETFTGDWENRFSINTHVWEPFFLENSLFFNSYNTQGYATTLSYPFIQKYSPGLTGFLGEITWVQYFSGPSSTSSLFPQVSFSFKYPETTIDVLLYAQFDENNDAFSPPSLFNSIHGTATITQYLMNDHLRANLQLGEYEEENSSGFNKTGKLCLVEFSGNIWTIQQGFWNPCIFVDNLCGNIYLEGYSEDDGPPHTFYGFNLHLNGRAGTAANLPWSILASYNQDSSGTPTFQLSYFYTLPESIVVKRRSPNTKNDERINPSNHENGAYQNP